MNLVKLLRNNWVLDLLPSYFVEGVPSICSYFTGHFLSRSVSITRLLLVPQGCLGGLQPCLVSEDWAAMAVISHWRSLSLGYTVTAVLAMSLVLMLRACDLWIGLPDTLRASMSIPDRGACTILSLSQTIWVVWKVVPSHSISNQTPLYQDIASLIPQ
jgi:hypothetical protein